MAKNKCLGKKYRIIFNTHIENNQMKFPDDKITAIMLIWWLKQFKDFHPEIFNMWKSPFRKIIFEFVYCNTFFFSFRWMCS